MPQLQKMSSADRQATKKSLLWSPSQQHGLFMVPSTKAPLQVTQRSLHTSPKLQSASETASEFQFGNILFGGPCNQKCYFCIGNQLPEELSVKNRRTWPLTNIDAFVERMRETDTQRIILTGTTSDPQLYKHEDRLVDYLREQLPGCHISLHTNGMLAAQKLDVFNKYDTVTMSINSFEPDTFEKIHGVRTQPDLEYLMKNSDVPIKLSCILTEENRNETESYLEKCSDLGVKRVSMRHIYHKDAEQAGPRWDPFEAHEVSREHCGNPVYSIDGVEVTHWKFEDVNKPSINLFSDGTLSEHYLLTDAVPNKLN